MNNALTFDVEEYFHAEAFSGVVRPEHWPALESRVVASTERLLDLLDDAATSATFFVLGHPTSSATSTAGATSSPATGTATR